MIAERRVIAVEIGDAPVIGGTGLRAPDRPPFEVGLSGVTLSGWPASYSPCSGMWIVPRIDATPAAVAASGRCRSFGA